MFLLGYSSAQIPLFERKKIPSVWIQKEENLLKILMYLCATNILDIQS